MKLWPKCLTFPTCIGNVFKICSQAKEVKRLLPGNSHTVAISQFLLYLPVYCNLLFTSELRKKKTFTSPSVYDPLKVSGTLSLKNYQNVSQDGSRRQELRNCKLTEEEIEIKLNHEKGLLLNSTGVMNKDIDLDLFEIHTRAYEKYRVLKQ